MDDTKVTGDAIDRLVTVEMRYQGMPRGYLIGLYDGARAAQGDEPLAMRAARWLVQHVQPGDNVFIATGAGVPPNLPKGEVDGPLGAAALARAVDLGLGATPILLCGAWQQEPVVAACGASGVTICDIDMAKQRRHAGVLLPFPTDDDEARSYSKDIITAHKPAICIAVEKLCPNQKGVRHGVNGLPRNIPDAALHVLFEEASAQNIPSIGIGDGGNEIGFGMIPDTVRKFHPFGDQCQCPCQGGIAARVATDVLVVAAVSNWGAYAVEACLSYLLKQPNILHSPDTQRRMLEDAVRAGAADGTLSRQNFSDDGISGEVHMALIRMLAEIVTISLEDYQRPY